MRNNKNIIIISFVFFSFIISGLIFHYAIANENKIDFVSKQSVPQNQEAKKEINEDINKVVERHRIVKPLEEITLSDIIQNENISPNMKTRVGNVLNQSHYEIDRYRTTISNHYKDVETRLVEFKKDLNVIHSFRDEMEENLNLAKLMIISLSVGIVCLSAIVIIMWRSVINVNRNDVEVLFSNERVKKDLKDLQKRIEVIELAYKNNER